MQRRRVIVATDLSPAGAFVAQHGALFASAVGASLHLVHYQSPLFAAPLEAGSLLPFFQGVPPSNATAYAQLDLIAESVDRGGMPIHAAIVDAPRRCLLTQVSDSDILVLGARPAGWLSIYLRPSFLSRCLSAIRGGLLVVPESVTTAKVPTVVCASGDVASWGRLSHYAATLSERLGATLRVLLQSDSAISPSARTAYASAESLLKASLSASSTEDGMWVLTPAPKADRFTRSERVAYERLLRSFRSPVLLMDERKVPPALSLSGRCRS